MLQLKLFGAPSLQRDGTLLTGRATQRHRLALLALLATAPGRRLSRDKLLAYLWPESDADRGRNLLKVATYVLRSDLGDDTLVSTGDELRLNTDLIEVDVAELEAALDRTDHARAVALYTGPFLDGFFLSDAPEFDHWVDAERARLADGYRNALEALAEAATRERDFPKAVEWWKLRAGQDPYDSRVALRLMQAQETSGNRAGALQHAAIHQRLLHEEFGVAPPPEIAALVERLRQEPGTEASVAIPARVELVVREDRAAERPRPVDVQSANPTSTKRPRWWHAAVALVCVLAFAGAVWAVWPRAADPEQSIVVLPFVNISGDESNEYFSDGLTEEIITRLAAVPGLKVISRTSAMHYKGSTKTLPEIARELNVDHILEGSVRPGDGSVRVSAQLIDARADGHVWADNFEHKLKDSFRVQEEIARDVASALELRLGARARRLLTKQGTRDPEAYELYQRARFLWNTRTREGHERAIDYYRRAIERDSSYADAYAGMANVYLTAYQLNLFSVSEAEAYSRLKWAAERALELDDESADAHVAFAVALKWQRNWPGAAREYRRALQLNPGHAIARSWYSLLLRGMGRSEDALRESRRAIQLDPFDIVVNHNYGWERYLARDYDGALEQFRRTIEIAPYPGAYRGLGFVHAQRGKHAEAIAAVHKSVELAPERPEFVADLAYVMALAGQQEGARAVLRDAKLQPLEPFTIARAHVALAETDSAFAWLERSSWNWPNRAFRDDPALDPLRSDRRFAQLIMRVDHEMGMR